MTQKKNTTPSSSGGINTTMEKRQVRFGQKLMITHAFIMHKVLVTIASVLMHVLA